MSSTSLSVSNTRSSLARVSTPASKNPIPVTESPGNWKHPRLSEITRRQNATVFGERNIKAIIWNLGAFLLLHVLRIFVAKYAPTQLITGTIKTYVGWTYFAIEVLPLINVLISCLPLVRPRDELADIPLTNEQRRLLGLPPSSAPATPGSVYSTPPRYSRTPSISGSIGSKANSPLSAKGSPVSGGRMSGSPYSPAAASPLFHKAVGYNGGRRSSFGSPSQFNASTNSFNASTASFNASTASSLFPDTPGTPSPSTGKRTSVGLNNKWLYDKGRRSSGHLWA